MNIVDHAPFVDQDLWRMVQAAKVETECNFSMVEQFMWFNKINHVCFDACVRITLYIMHVH